MFEIVFSKKANDTFDSIQTQLLARWGSDIVIKFEKRALMIIGNIAESPFMYPSVKSAFEIRKVVIHKNCSLYYKVKGQKVVLLFFWDNRQDPIFL